MLILLILLVAKVLITESTLVVFVCEGELLDKGGGGDHGECIEMYDVVEQDI